MTLCIAATCLDEKNRPRMIVSSDWRTELGTLAAAEVQNKLYWLFKGSWCVLIAGTVPSALRLLTTIGCSINEKKLTRGNVEDQLSKAVLQHRSKLVKLYVKSRHSVTFKYFRTHRQEFDKGKRAETESGIENMQLGCVLLVCTFIKGTPFIFQVNEDCTVIREENFAAIGSGSEVANAILCYRQQNDDLAVDETLYSVYEATKFARRTKVPGVGKLHAFSVLSPGRKQRRRLRELSKCFDKYGPQKVKKVGLPKESWEQY